jgi:DNA-binding transcriptional LysR family regulator
LAITTAEMRDPQIETEALSPLPPFVAVCASTHPLSVTNGLGKMWTAVELADYLQIVVTDPSPITEGLDFGVLSRTWRVSDLATKHAMILAGTGWGNLPLWMVNRDLDEGRLARVAVAALGAEAETALNAFLLRRIDEPLGPAARCLREGLLMRFSR